MASIYDYKVKKRDGKELKLSDLKKKGYIKWNFAKFLVDRDGKVVGRFGPTDKPEEMDNKIKELL